MASRTDPLGKVASFTYDVNGRLTGRVDRNGHSAAYTRDAAGRITRIDYPDGSSVAYEYDELGRLTGMRDAVTTTTYSYDEAGRVTGVGDADGFALGYVYDDAGNVTQVTYPDGSAAIYAYDLLNRLTSVTTSQGESASYVYDAAGRIASGANFDGIATTYTHDAAGGLTGMSSVVASYFFTRDGNGRIVHSIETEPLSPSPVAGSTEYSYNDKKNRLLSAGAVAYGYDDEGQLTSAGSAGYSYDYEHRLAAIGSNAQFAYDGRGNRLRATRGGVVKRYIYAPWGNLLAEADGNGNITRTYIYGHGLLAMRTAGGGLYCYHFNTTGSTIALTDATGGIVNSYAYDPFGNVLGQQESISQPFKFVGQYGVIAEANDSLYYMRARYYDPRVGRFISEDPIGFAGGDVNLYGYVGNDPINRADPWGLFGFMDCPAEGDDGEGGGGTCGGSGEGGSLVGGGSLGGAEPILPAEGGGMPPIKAGSANGFTAGMRFPESVRNAAKAENPSATCVYCGRQGAASQVDHAIPKACGGNATLDNAQLACPHCNASKGASSFPKTPPLGYTGPWPPDHW